MRKRLVGTAAWLLLLLLLLPGRVLSGGVPQLDYQGLMDYIIAQQGKVVLVNFWATWCGPCIKEMPDLLALREAVDPEKLVIVGISLDYDPKTLDRYLEKKPLNFPTYIADPDLMQLLQIRSIPMMRLYDKDGMEVMRQEGYVPLEELRPTIDNLLPKDE